MKKKLLLLLPLLCILFRVNAQEYQESFENPNCLTQNGWTIINNDDDYLWTIDTDDAHTGNKSVAIISTFSASDDFLVTPLVEIKEGSTFSFWARSQYSFSPEKFSVYITEGAPKRDNLTKVLQEVENVPAAFQQYTYDLTAYKGKNVYLAIHTTSEFKSKLIIDDVSLPARHIPKVAPLVPSLTVPSNESTDIEPTTTLQWDAVPFTDSYLISIGTNPEADNLFINKEITSPYLEIKDLDYSQKYYWRVSAKNSYGTSNSSEIHSFNTMDDPTVTTFPWIEDFESKRFPPLGWKTINVDNDTKQWIRSLAAGVSSSKCASINGYRLADDWLITPPVQLPIRALLKFSAKTYGSEIEIGISTTGKSVDDFEIVHTQETTGSFDEYLVDLSKYQEQKVYVAFHHNARQALDLDDISIKEGTSVQLNKITYSSPSNAGMARGSVDQLLTKIEFDLVGDVGTLPLENLQVRVTPNSAVKNIKVFRTLSDKFSDQNLISEHAITDDNLQLIQLEDQTLNKGISYLWITADINDHVALGTEVKATPFSASIAQEEHLLDENSSYQARQVMNIVEMTTGTNNLTVDGSLSFYDDGGMDNNYSEEFEGTVTFRPRQEGKIISISFDKFDIFNTSSIGKNDLFEVYKGDSKNSENIIGTYSKTPAVIESESLDGALTIYFKANTSLPRSGWEATVKEVTAQKMTVTSIEGIAPANKRFKPADNHVLLTGIHIATSHTISPMHLTSIPFDLTDNNALDNISRLHLVTSGIKKSPLNIEPISTIELTSKTGQLDVDIPLSSGDNYFWILADIKPTAKNEEKFSLSLTELNFGTTKSPLALQEEFDISTDYTMPESGSNTVNIGTEGIRFTDSGKDNNHHVTDNTIVTFVPKNKGDKVRITFSDFDLNYSRSSYYGTRSEFTIYDGSSTTTTPLFKIDSRNKSKGPGKAITSSSDDGALTIRFVANTRTSSQTKKGWNAVVKSVKNEPIHANKVVVNNLNPTESGIGLESTPLINAVVTTAGLQPNATSGNITWDLDFGNTNLENLEKVNLYYLANNNNFSLAQKIQSFSKEQLPQIQSSQELAEGENYFWFTFDIGSNAVENQTLQVKIDQTRVTSQPIEIEGNNEFAQTILKRFINFSTQTNTFTVGIQPVGFYDDGGKTQNYSQNIDHKIIFIPETEGQYVRIDWNQIALDDIGFDELKVYNGKTATDENLISSYEKTLNTPQINKATNSEGALTVHFKSSAYGVPKTGWDAVVKTFTPTPISLFSNNVTPAPYNSIKKGEENYIVLKSELYFKGERDSEIISEIEGDIGSTTTASDILRAKLWVSHNLNNFSQAEQAGECLINSQNSRFSFDTNIEVNKESNVYLWITFDIASNATIGHYIDANITTLQLKNQKYTPNAKQTQKNAIQGGMHGIYTIGISGDYSTLTEAIETLTTRGIDGATTLNIQDGTYPEVITIPFIKGASSINTLRIQSESEDATKVLLKSKTASNDINSFITIHRGRHITFKNVTIESTHTGLDQLVLIDDNSQHIKFEGCRLKAPISTSYQNDINLIKTEAESIKNQNNDHLQFISNHFEGGYIALSLGGTGTVVLPKQKDCLVQNNHFLNQGSKSIYCHDQINITIQSNHIENTETTKSGYQAMDIYRAKGGVKIFNNTVSLQLSKNAIGLELRGCEGTEKNPIRLFNNMISINSKTGKSYGLNITRQTRYIDVAYNSINMYGANASAVGVGSLSRGKVSYPLAHIYRYNNVVALIGQSIYFRDSNEQDQTQVFKNNLNAAEGVQIGQNRYVEIEAINNLSAFSNNISSPAAFISDTDLHLTHITELNMGEIVDHITKDIDNDNRTLPYSLGADQFIEITQVPPVIINGYPKVVGATHDKISVEVMADKAGKVFCYIYKDKASALTADEIIAQAAANAAIVSKSLAANKTTQVALKELSQNNDYRIDVVTVDLRGTPSELKHIKAHTPYAPTQIADFETIKNKDRKIISGTVIASNVTIKETSTGSHNHVAGVLANQTATFLFNNTAEGLTTKGFYLRSDASATMTIHAKDQTMNISLASTKGQWHYISLLEYGDILSFDIDAQSSTLWIDDIHRAPAALSVAPIASIRTNKAVAAEVSIEVSGGHAPYTIQYNETKQTNRTGIFYLDITLESSNTAYFTITDQENTAITTSTIIEVTTPIGTMDFESFPVEPNSFYRGIVVDGSVHTKLFESGIGMPTFYSQEMFTWTGLNISNKTNKDVAGGLANQHTAITGIGANDTKNYGVVYAFSKETIEISGQPEGAIISGMYVTNNTYAVTSMKHGDGFAKKFGGETGTDSDWFKLVATGYDAQNNKTAVTEFYLADFRFDAPSKDYIIEDWRWMDLSVLGKVSKIEFSMESSDVNQYNQANTPAYFCLDNFNGSSPYDQGPSLKKEIPTILFKDQEYTLDLKEYIEDPDGDALSFAIENLNETFVYEINDGILIIRKGIKSVQPSRFNIIAKSLQKRLNIEVQIDASTAIYTKEQTTTIKVGPNPTSNYLNIESVLPIQNIQIYSQYGQCILKKEMSDYSDRVDLSSWDRGVYYIQVQVQGQVVKQKVILQ
ncbi:DUF4465 domain-containing protein [Prolixibacteraceae bacterium]|nr:DUF4465 domain-containing protein [Prolixibacteraceae bacterium]